MNIRTPLIRSCLAFGLVAATATAAALQPTPVMPAHAVPGASTSVAANEHLGVTWLPMVRVHASIEPLRVTWLPGVQVVAHVERTAMVETPLKADDSLASNSVVELPARIPR